MKTTVRFSLLCVLLLGLSVPCRAGDEQFSFYGLQFGMTRTQVGERYALQGDLVKNPGHGMTDVELVFDREGQLMEIRASWPRPEEAHELQGLQRALRERFLGPVSNKFPAIAATLDEYGNRAAIRVTFLSTAIRERNIDFHKARYLKILQ